MADQRYYNMNAKGEDNRYKVNTNILRMMQANPALGTGYIIGSMLGENYWGKKRAKSFKEGDRKGRGEDGSIGADANGTYGTNNSTPASTSNKKGYYDSMNEALEEYKQGNPNGKVLYSGSGNNSSNSNPGVYIDTAKGIYPQTPQQANKPAVTLDNVGSGGGAPGVMDAWNNMNNASMYNAGNTAMYTNGARNLGNVIGADANGVYGVTPASSAPSVANFPQKPANGPAPYTDDQLRQIQGQNFTAEELAKMASPQELARMVVMARGGAPTAASQVAQGQPSGYVPQGAAPASGVDRAVQQAANEAAATNTPIVADAVPDVANLRIHGNTGQGGGGQAFGPAPEYVDPAQNLAVSNNPYAGYGYGVSEQGLFNGSAVDRYQEYLRNLQRDASGNF